MVVVAAAAVVVVVVVVAAAAGAVVVAVVDVVDSRRDWGLLCIRPVGVVARMVVEERMGDDAEKSLSSLNCLRLFLVVRWKWKLPRC